MKDQRERVRGMAHYIAILGVWLVSILSAGIAVGQNETWLDKPLKNWNMAGARIPKAPQPKSDPVLRSRCGTEVRPATTVGDRQVTRMGWKLYGPLLIFGKTSVIRALADVDGMCRPLSFQIFVFVGEKFAGTLAPTPMNSRADGSAAEIRLRSATQVQVEFARYIPSDPLCCPSKKQSVEYSIERGLVIPSIEEGRRAPANTTADEATVPVEGIVTGRVEYRERLALLADAQLTMRIVDTAGRSASATVISEESINAAGNVPISFTLRYNRGRIDPRHTYHLQVLLRSGDNIWENEREVSVITNGETAGVRVMLKKLK